MKRYTVRVYDLGLIERLDQHLQSDVPQNTLLCKLLERALNNTSTDLDCMGHQLDRIEELLRQGITIGTQEPQNGQEPQAAACGLEAMLGGFVEGRR